MSVEPLILTELSFDVNNDELFIRTKEDDIEPALKKDERKIVLNDKKYSIVYPVTCMLDKFQEVVYNKNKPVMYSEFFDDIFGFYEGDITDDIVSSLSENSGIDESEIEEMTIIAEAMAEKVHFCGLRKLTDPTKYGIKKRNHNMYMLVLE